MADQFPKNLPDDNMSDAEPERKMYSSSDAPEENIQDTETSEEGDLAFLRRKGVNQIQFDRRRR